MFNHAVGGANMSDRQLIAQALRLHEAATPRPWQFDGGEWGHVSHRNVGPNIASDIQEIADGNFIAESRSLLPRLAYRLEKANRKIEELQEQKQDTACSPLPCTQWEKLKERIYSFGEAELNSSNREENAFQFALRRERWMLCREIYEWAQCIEQGKL